MWSDLAPLLKLFSLSLNKVWTALIYSPCMALVGILNYRMVEYCLLQCVVCALVIFLYCLTWLKTSTLPSDYNKHSKSGQEPHMV